MYSINFVLFTLFNEFCIVYTILIFSTVPVLLQYYWVIIHNGRNISTVYIYMYIVNLIGGYTLRLRLL